MAMKLAITGATGFLARYIVSRLAGRGHACRCWYRDGSDRGGFEPLKRQIEWMPGELGDRSAAGVLVEGAEAVIHSAFYHPNGEDGPLEFVNRNLLGTLQLIEAARSAGVGRFIFLSSCAVHEKILDDRPLDEAHPLWPTSHYGAHKAAIEKFVHSYGLGQGYSICALRPTGIYGLARPPRRSKWFDLVREIVRGRPVECRYGGKEVHAADVARAVEILLGAERIAGEAYNCCDRYVSEYEVASIAKRISGSRSPIGGVRATPKHQIETGKLRRLGMQFGGLPLLEKTIGQLIEAAAAE